MTTSTERQSTPLSVSGSAEESAPAVKKSRNRKQAKKPVPHSSTLHGLWGKTTSTDEQSERTEKGTEAIAMDLDSGNGIFSRAERTMVFKITPSKLAATIGSRGPSQGSTTPPPLLTEVVLKTSIQTEEQNMETPKSPRSGHKKRTLPQSPSEGVRRSPRNHRVAPTNENPIAKEKKIHPFFLGKEARRALQTAKQSTPPPHDTVTDIDGQSRKRQKSSPDQQSPIPDQRPSIPPAKSLPLQAAKPVHPFFMSRTASMESTGSSVSYPIVPPQGKTVYLSNGKAAPFPPHGMCHVYDPGTESLSSLKPLNLRLNRKKGKSRYRNYLGEQTKYTNLANLINSIDFIPPEKLIVAKSDVQKEAKSILTSRSHDALLRAYQILLKEDRLRDPDGEIWTHKFRPRRAAEVLCSHTQAIDLRDWIAGDRKIVSPPKEMGDFIVDEDDEDDDSCCTESEADDDSPRKSRRRRKVDTFLAYSNVVILTGPHGVGKSAAVEAVAEELGYQVFEISPGSRRGAREVMDAVGEVGQSELVTKHSDVPCAPSLSPLKVGSISTLTDCKSRGRKGLICLDEVDVLYEEDKGFWTCVTALVEKSRRPVIMTCNDSSVIPENFANCKFIEFSAADPEIVRDYLGLITLSQGHIIDPTLLEQMYLKAKRDLRQTLTLAQFWCQFGVGDSRCGGDWINWGGRESDWVMSRGTYADGVEWRQEKALGVEMVLETVEEVVPDLDVEDMIFPHYFQFQSTDFPMSERGKMVFEGLTGMAEFLDSMSFLDSNLDQQFTAYEITTFVNPSADDVLSKPILRQHPGRRFEKPQGGESRWSPTTRISTRNVLEEKLMTGVYRIAPFSSETIINQPLKDLLRRKRYISREDVYDPLEEILYSSIVDDRFFPTTGTLHSFDTIILDVVPQIRHIVRSESERRRTKPEQTTLDNIWSNRRVTRGQAKEEREGRKRYFDDRIDAEAILKTWLEIDGTGNEDLAEELHEKE